MTTVAMSVPSTVVPHELGLDDVSEYDDLHDLGVGTMCNRRRCRRDGFSEVDCSSAQMVQIHRINQKKPSRSDAGCLFCLRQVTW